MASGLQQFEVASGLQQFEVASFVLGFGFFSCFIHFWFLNRIARLSISVICLSQLRSFVLHFRFQVKLEFLVFSLVFERNCKLTAISTATTFNYW
ncbi:hypothetical protein V6N13_143094 [Hibiscus sabdariffa]